MNEKDEPIQFTPIPSKCNECELIRDGEIVHETLTKEECEYAIKNHICMKCVLKLRKTKNIGNIFGIPVIQTNFIQNKNKPTDFSTKIYFSTLQNDHYFYGEFIKQIYQNRIDELKEQRSKIKKNDFDSQRHLKTYIDKSDGRIEECERFKRSLEEK